MFKFLAGLYMIIHVYKVYGNIYKSNPNPAVDLCLFLGIALIAISLDNSRKKRK